MIPYLDRDLIRTFLLAFLTMLAFVLVGVFIKSLLEMFRFLEGARVSWFLLMFVLEVPRQLTFAIPVSTAVAVLWTYTVKARTNELLACFVGGLSPLRLAAPLLLMSAMLTGAGWATQEYLATSGDRAAERIERMHLQGQNLETIVRERNVFQKALGNRFYYLNSYNPLSRRMNHPFVVQLNDDWTGPAWRLDAEYAAEVEADGEVHWGFYEATYREYDAAGNMVVFRQSPLIMDAEVNPPIEQELDRYIKQRFREDQMTTPELADYIELFRLQNRPSTRLRTIFHFNFGLPLGTLVLALVMCGHIVRPTASGVISGFGGGMILMAGYFVLVIFGRELSMDGLISPVVGAYGANAIFTVIGVILLFRNRAL